MTISREWKLGTHLARFEEPDILWVRIQGETTLQNAIDLTQLYGELGVQKPIFVVTDLTGATTVEAEARQHVSQHSNPAWFLGSVYIGAGFVQKAVAKSLTFVHAMTGRLTFDLHFVSTEREARELIIRERAQRAARVA
ncbi:hypothetical protein [Vitiosangium sp. GDMCC 1.1324]|uniref:hypothetical protein n=1 Tax=Vitiosangium sp. (strain GDMCC 1.1324) TaxID=2138576 RepID=UPI000D336BBE|nr:hypothetical protein [Vitiosangium sp. GDMCC 1.1324]PTL82993.1 hypothetical protein DAT35_13290 [Vitiosangium sp. GDMCC 1.1324]